MQVAKENADVVIMDDNFTTILNVTRWGRSVYINIQKFVQFQLTVNIVALVIILFPLAFQVHFSHCSLIKLRNHFLKSFLVLYLHFET